MTTILTADDSISMRQMVTYTLQEGGFEVLEASDGEEALEIARVSKADLVISDLNMPKMDGITLIRELRALPAYRFVPILMLTTESGEDLKRDGKAAGATGWLVKPFDPVQLLSVIRRVLG
ncbi:MAG: response regulator [Planctomycetota bacterium]